MRLALLLTLTIAAAAPAAEPPPVTAPPPGPTASTAPVKAPKPLTLDQAIAELNRLPAGNLDKREAIARRWAAGADLAPIPVPPFHADPKDPDDNHRSEINKANEILAMLREGRDGHDVKAFLSAMYWAQQMHDILDHARAPRP